MFMPLLAVLGAVLALAGFVLTLGYWNANRALKNEARALLAKASADGTKVVTEAMLDGLPAPVKRYLTYSGVVGKPMVRTVRLKQTGRIRESEQQAWMNITAEEYYSVNPPGFIWVGTVKMAGLPLVQARDRYVEGKGHMRVTAGSVYPFINASGAEMDQGAMMRYLNEMTWFPSSFLSENVTFEAVDDYSANVTLTDRGKSVTAKMCFDEEGRFVNFFAPRYRMVKDHSELETWSTPITEYGEMAGLKLPVKGKGVWNLKDGDLEYIDLAVTDIEYDVSDVYSS